jgi:glucose-6-phosphate 1-dehydrogenase
MTTEEDVLHEKEIPVRASEPCVLVIFGATGDLTGRKLMPAIYKLYAEEMAPEGFTIVGFARREWSDEDFRSKMLEDMKKAKCPIDDAKWKTFSEKLFYHRSEFDSDEGYDTLKKRLEEMDQKMGTKGNRLFYLATQPSFFTTITAKLKERGLVYDPTDESKYSRVIIEKPFGTDLDSALALQHEISQHFSEDQIFRIDHYLAKETVQNLLAFRFANSLFESLWNYKHIDRVVITVSEDIGVGTRGKFFEEAGLMRDIVQNHVMQLLSLVAMESPVSLGASCIHDEKVKVLRSIRPMTEEEVDEHTVRGQYGAGYEKGEQMKGYREEDNVDPHSKIETYTAVRLFIDNWRWAGVPFYLRAGKRLAEKTTEIAVFFQDAPGSLFKNIKRKNAHANVLTIRIQPDEGISFSFNCKVPGLEPRLQSVDMDFRYSTYFNAEPPAAYQRLILDAMLGDNTLFARIDEVVTSWKIVDPIIKRWAATEAVGFPNYAAGSWGPDEAWHMIGYNPVVKCDVSAAPKKEEGTP